MVVDNREQYKDEFWYQGFFLYCSRYANWTNEEICRAVEQEKHRAYVNYRESYKDVKKRKLVYVFESISQCEFAIFWHNVELEKLQLKTKS